MSRPVREGKIVETALIILAGLLALIAAVLWVRSRRKIKKSAQQHRVAVQTSLEPYGSRGYRVDGGGRRSFYVPVSRQAADNDASALPALPFQPFGLREGGQRPPYTPPSRNTTSDDGNAILRGLGAAAIIASANSEPAASDHDRTAQDTPTHQPSSSHHDSGGWAGGSDSSGGPSFSDGGVSAGGGGD